MSGAIATELVEFWRDAGMAKWFRGGEAFDAECRARWLDAHFAAARREFDGWMDDADGALALVLLLDQIPRNVFRNSGHAFATDPLALHYAGRAIDAGFDAQVDPSLRFFFYLPFEHSEDSADQQLSLQLHHSLGPQASVWAEEHAVIIQRFGRFPHRNHVLGRDTSVEERTFLDEGGFAG